MQRSRPLQSGGSRDVEEGIGLVRRPYNTRSSSSARANKSHLGSKYDSVNTQSSSFISGGGSGVATLSTFGVAMISIGALVTLLLVVVLYVVPNTQGTTDRIDYVEYVYRNVTRSATYCLTPNNVDPTILAGWML
jgi:hypothetical protein